MNAKPDCHAVLFDLDGTLADTAPDLGAALNDLLREQGQPEKPMQALRALANHGAVGLIQFGFAIAADAPEMAELRSRFLQIYAAHICDSTQLYAGVKKLLKNLDDAAIRWAVVTNKPEYLSVDLMQALNLDRRCASLVGGDTTAHSKPHPLPILHACEQLELAAEACIYVGDAERDMHAAKAAGMTALAATWGYIEAYEDPSQWPADALVDCPLDVLSWLREHRKTPLTDLPS